MDLQTLINAGLPATEVHTDENGVVQATFSRELTPAEWQLFLTLTSPARARKALAKGNAILATTLKNVTPQQAVNYIESNVVDLTTAKTALKLIARMLIAMRDEIWPDLPESN